MNVFNIKQNLAEDTKALREDINILHSEPAFVASYADSKYPASNALSNILHDTRYGTYDEDPKWNRILQAEKHIDNEELNKLRIVPHSIICGSIPKISKTIWEQNNKFFSGLFGNEQVVSLKTVQQFASNIYYRIKRLAEPRNFKAVSLY